MSRGKVDAKLFKMMCNNECHLYRENGEIRAIMCLNFCDLPDFVKAVGEHHFEEEGVSVVMKRDYVWVDLTDIIDNNGDNLKDYEDCFDSSEWEDYFPIKVNE